jgi:hypothetical protein
MKLLSGRVGLAVGAAMQIGGVDRGRVLGPEWCKLSRERLRVRARRRIVVKLIRRLRLPWARRSGWS